MDTALIREWYRTIIDYQLCQALNDTLNVFSEKQAIAIQGKDAQIDNFEQAFVAYTKQNMVEAERSIQQQSLITQYRARGDDLARKNRLLTKTTVAATIVAILALIL